MMPLYQVEDYRRIQTFNACDCILELSNCFYKKSTLSLPESFEPFSVWGSSINIQVIFKYAIYLKPLVSVYLYDSEYVSKNLVSLSWHVVNLKKEKLSF
jgi:hypothetical protein